MATFRNHGLGAVIALAMSAANGATIVGGSPSFTAVRAQLEPAPGCVAFDCDVHTSVGSTFAEIGMESGAYAKGRAEFGVNGAYAIVNPSQVDREAYAESIWSDGFVIHGGTGQANMQIVVRVDGVLDGRGRPGGPGSNAFYTMFLGNAPMTCDFDNVSCSGQTIIPLAEPLHDGEYFRATIAFEYDKPFYIASYLGAEVVGGSTGTADFYHSAHLGIDAPEGATLTSVSGTTYPAASAVPEPEAMSMLFAGICMVAGLAGRRARARLL